MNAVIRAVQPEECALLGEALFKDVSGPSLERLRAQLAGFGDLPGDLALCAKSDGRVVGAVWARRPRGAGSAESETPALALTASAPDIERALLRAMLDALRERGYRRASLAVRADRAGQVLYEEMGFSAAREVDGMRVMIAELRRTGGVESHAERAARLFREGCNCAQSVFVAYCDLTGLDEALAIRLSASFGGGIGRLREVCGALSGALMALGALRAPLDPTDRGAKALHYARVQQLANRFRAHNGSLLCRDLLGDQAGSGHVPAERTEAYYQSRPCERLIYDAAGLLDRMLRETRGN